MNVKVYNKLVRNRIPEIIEASGKSCTCETLSDERYIALLNQKLQEEVAEYLESGTLEELADIGEVMSPRIFAMAGSWAASLRGARCSPAARRTAQSCATERTQPLFRWSFLFSYFLKQSRKLIRLISMYNGWTGSQREGDLV